MDRCRKRLTRWKANYLPFGGWGTLIKATLSNLPIYYLSLFKIPKVALSDYKINFGPLSLVTTPEFGSFSLPVPLLYPLSSLPSHLTWSPLLSLVSLSEFSLSPSKVKAFSEKLHGYLKSLTQFFYLYLTLLTNACLLCLSAKESNNHLFLHCHFCWRLWDKLFKLLNLNWMICDKMSSFFFSWRLSLSKKTPTTV